MFIYTIFYQGGESAEDEMLKKQNIEQYELTTIQSFLISVEYFHSNIAKTAAYSDWLLSTCSNGIISYKSPNLICYLLVSK